MTRLLAILAAVVGLSTPALAGPAHDLFGLTDVDAPIWPEQIPIFARADGRYLTVTAAKKVGCDPKDDHGEGRCD